ncbi:MAG: carbonic anhydrase [Alphaproteobacteria bacterium]|nr:carbonic anhydrase [Alphaproteobacteria bacterium]
MKSYDELIDGYQRFRTGTWQTQHARWEQLREGQAPRVMVIACSDSRVDPAQIFDVDPGEIFVVRNVAAMVPPYETSPGQHGVSAALEFAVQFLKVEHVVVMGHGLCGGCQAALTQNLHGKPLGQGGFVAEWIGMLDEVREDVVRKFGTTGRDAERAMEHAAVKKSLEQLRTFPCVQEKEADGSLALHGAFFAISDGVLHLLDEASGEFSPAG